MLYYMRYKLSYFLLGLSLKLIPDRWVRFIMESYIRAGAEEIRRVQTDKDYFNDEEETLQ